MIKILFVLLLLVFPIGQIGRVELGGGVNILLNDLIVCIVVVAWLVKKLWMRETFVLRELTKPMLAFFTLALVALIINSPRFTLTEVFVSSLYLYRWVVYAGIYFVVRDFPEKFQQKILLGLIVAGVITSLLGFFQYVLYPDLRNLYYAGWDEHLYRLFSTFLDPNFAGAIFVLTFILAVSFLLRPRKQLTRLPFIISIAAGFLSFIGLLLTYSRGSFVSVLIAVLLLLLLKGKKKLIIAFLVVLLAGIILLPKHLQSEGVKLLRTVSIEKRLESMEHAIAIFKDSPLFGVGFNTYRFVQFDYGFITEQELRQSHAAAGVDNSFLFVLATTGIFGFLAYLFLWYRVMRAVWGDWLVITSLIAIFVHALFVNSLFYPWIMEWLWILVGVARYPTIRKSL